MARRTLPVILTANDLMDGDAVWWTDAGWSRVIARARRFDSAKEAAPVLESLGQDSSAIGVYAVELDPETDAPALRREAIRAAREPSFAYLSAAAHSLAPGRREAA
ncbi:MAG: DUF2849 domain-containing protein [Pseudomonadota bacterium]